MGSERQKEFRWLIVAPLLAIGTLALGIVLLYGRSVLIPFVLAVFISLLIAPVLDFQVLRLRIPRPIAATVTLLIALVILAGLYFFVSSAVEAIIATAGRYSDSFVALTERVVVQMEDWGLPLDKTKIASDLSKYIPTLAQSAVGTVVNIISSAFLVLIFVLFLVIGRNPRTARPKVYRAIEKDVRRYLAIKVVFSIVTGLLVWAILSVLGLELAGVFGMLAFLLNFIPSIGSIIATFLPVPMAVAQYQNLWMVVLVIALPGAVQITIGNIIEPKLMGSRLNLHPITVLLALSFWGLLWGIIGMLLAVPMTAVLRLVLMRFATLRPIGLLLAGKLPDFGLEE